MSKQNKPAHLNTKELGKRIKLARIEMDLKQVDLAVRAGVSQKDISRYETGRTAPSLATLVKISSSLNKPTAYFLDSPT